jgi:hypothetical protein
MSDGAEFDQWRLHTWHSGQIPTISITFDPT